MLVSSLVMSILLSNSDFMGASLVMIAAILVSSFYVVDSSLVSSTKAVMIVFIGLTVVCASLDSGRHN